jgi:hypothetical protein
LLRLPFLNIGVETFHLSGKTLVAIDQLKRREIGFAKADAQFFKMIGDMPSGQEPLLTYKSSHLKWIESVPKRGSSGTCSGYPDIIGIWSLYKFRKQIKDFLGARSQTTFKMHNWWVANAFFL